MSTKRWKLTGSAESSRVAQWTQRGMIRSIQRGTITIANTTTSNTATINAVVTERCRLRYVGASYDTDANMNNGNARLALTNATTITATRQFNQNGTTVSYEITEYVPGVLRSVQRGTIALAGVASNTATVNAVVLLGSELTFTGFDSDDTTGDTGRYLPKGVLTNTTTVTATKGIATSTCNVGYELAEFYL